MTHNIKNKRIELKISQTQLADKLKMDRRTYQRKEKNDGFNLDELRQILNIIGYEVILLPKDMITKL